MQVALKLLRVAGQGGDAEGWSWRLELERRGLAAAKAGAKMAKMDVVVESLLIVKYIIHEIHKHKNLQQNKIYRKSNNNTIKAACGEPPMLTVALAEEAGELLLGEVPARV